MVVMAMGGMMCEVCGLELAVLEWDDEAGAPVFVCRNLQCTRGRRDMKRAVSD
jgi:hypothetical protein